MKTGLLPAKTVTLRVASLATGIICLIVLSVCATTYYVSTTGVDDAGRNGTSSATAWKSLAYACEKVPEGDNEIRLGAGTYIATKTATPRSGITIRGAGRSGSNATIIQASPTWNLQELPFDYREYKTANYLIAVKTWDMGFEKRVHDVTIRDIAFRSAPDHLIDGALFFWDCDRITIHDVNIRDFRWTGMLLAFDKELDIYNCEIINANVEEHGHWSGNIQTHWITDCKFHEITSINNKPLSEKNWGVGIKGGGHTNVKVYNSTFTGWGFSMEIMFDNEYGLEIYGNSFSSPLSIPKSLGEDPNKRGQPYTFWIHDNYMTSSYAIEGPRNHVKFDHNFIQISTNTNGRCYTQFGGDNAGPLWIHHNIVENCDRSFIWKGGGMLNNVKVYNNTVFYADAKDRTAPAIDCWGSDMNNWEVKNNLFYAHPDRKRDFGGNVDKFNASNNLCVNINMVPSGNFIDNDPGLTLSGKKPYPYYAPRLETSFVVDKGVDVGLPFKGAAPDIGAYEFGDETWIYREKSKSMPHPVQIRLRVDPAIKRLYVLSIGREQNMRAFVRILNTQGRIIETAALPESGTGAVDLSGLASGAYIAEVVANGNSIGNHPFAHR